MSAELGIGVQPVASAEEAGRGADIVASCTDSMEPTIRAEWLSPGMHVTNVGPYEIDQECLARFDLKVRQGEAGSGSEALRDRSASARSGAKPARLRRRDRRADAAASAETSGSHRIWRQLPAHCRADHGAHHGRTSADQISFYHNFGNQGLQFACVGGMVFERAREQGLGSSLPDEWFLQDVRN